METDRYDKNFKTMGEGQISDVRKHLGSVTPYGNGDNVN